MRAALEPHRVLLGAAVTGLLFGTYASFMVAAVGAVLLAAAIARLVPHSGFAVGGACVLVACALIAGQRLEQLAEPANALRIGSDFAGELTVLEPLRAASNGQPQRGLMKAGDATLLVRAIVPARRVETGEIVQVRGRLVPPTRGARALRAHATLDASEIIATGRRRGGVQGTIDSVRRRALDALGAADGEAGALVAGVVLGQDDRLPADLQDQMRASGLTHLTAASGQNVALLAAIAALAGMVAGISVQARWLLALALICVYVPLSGAGPSIVRAAVMGAATIAAAIAGRPGSRIDALLLAAALTLGYDPRLSADLGWQLSFSAVAGIAVAGASLSGGLVRCRLPVPVAAVLATTVAATLATAPLLAVRVQRPSPWSVPANALAAPAVPVLMGIGFPAAVVGQLAPGPAHSLGSPARVPAAYLIALARRFAEPPTLHKVGAPGRGTFRITALDIGQGDATLLQAGGANVLVDTGPPGAGLLAQLRARSVRSLDVLVLTHGELDHAGTAPELLAEVPVRLVLDGRAGLRSELSAQISAAIRACRCRSVRAQAGMRIGAGPLALDVRSPLTPELPPGANPNDYAIVLVASAFSRTALLTADAESPVLDRLDLPAVDLLKVSHHGSADSGLPEVLERTRPGMAVIEVGEHNRHGHPVPDVLTDLKKAGVPTWRTDRDGAVAFDLSRGATSVRPERP